MQIFLVLTELGLEDFGTETMVKLEQQFKKKAIKAQNITFGANVIGNVHLHKCFLKNVNLRLQERAIVGIIYNKLKLLYVRNINFNEVNWYLKYNSYIGRDAFG